MILQWNLNGIKTHKPDLELLQKEYDLKCICLQETHLKPNDEFNLRGYNTYRLDDSSRNKAAGGVSISIINSIISTPVPLTTNLQAIAIKILVPSPIYICNVYLPPSDVITKEQFIDLLHQIPNPKIILGDFNAHGKEWGSVDYNKRGRDILKALGDFNLEILNTGEATYLSPAHGTLSSVDISACSPNIFHRLSWNVLEDQYNSDHFPIIIHLDWLSTLQMPNSRKKWIMEKANWDSFEQYALLNEWDPTDVNTNCHSLTNVIYNAALQSIPQTSGKIKRKPVPWFNEQCKTAINSRRKAYRKFKLNMSLENLINYKKQKAIARKTIKECKKLSWTKYVSGITTSTPASEVWKKIRAIQGNLTPEPIILNINGRTTADPSLVVEELAKAYSLNNFAFDPDFIRIKQEAEAHPLIFTVEGPELDYNILFSVWELESVLKGLKGKSPGPDGILYSMIQHLSTEGMNSLLNLYNQIWTSGTFPDSWRLSYIIPAHKRGKDRRLASSYRPISLSSCMCKIMERMVHRRLQWTIENDKLLKPQQCAFRQGRSTIDNLVLLETEILSSFVNKQDTIAIFFDIKNAFDTCWKHNILEKLHNWGFRGRLPIFIKEFLRDRKFKACLGNIQSNERALKHGIPQGSVLSTALFNLAIDGITECLTSRVKCLLYADDVAILCRSKSLSYIKVHLQTTLNRLNDWAKHTGFQFSLEKTKCIHFTRRKTSNAPPNLYLGNYNLQYTNSMKFLGMTLDSRLNWQNHIKNAKTTCIARNRILRILSNTSWGADRESLLRIYNSIVLSKLDYGSQVYSSAKPSNLKLLDSVHHDALRSSIGAFRSTPVISLCAEAGIQPLNFIRQKQSIKYIAKIWRMPDHPCYKYVFFPKYVNLYSQNPRASLPLTLRMTRTIENLQRVIIPDQIKDIPPWTFPQPICYFGLKSAVPKSWNSVLLEKLEKISEKTVLFTDGSKTNSSTACAYIDGTIAHKIKLDPLSNVFTAECQAISAALHSSLSRPVKNIVICSDSESALKNILGMYPKNYNIYSIQKNIKLLNDQQKLVHFIWVPGHRDIKGNILADQAAAQAHDNNIITETYLSPEEIYSPLINLVDQEWVNVWGELRENKLRMIKSYPHKWISSFRQNRREEVIIARLRLGHTRLTHSHLMRKEEPPICRTCNEIYSVRHIFESCRQYETLLKKHKIPPDISEALGNDEDMVDRVINFLKEVDLSNEI